MTGMANNDASKLRGEAMFGTRSQDCCHKLLHVSGALEAREQVFKLCEWKWLPRVLRRVVHRSRVEGGGGRA